MDYNPKKPEIGRAKYIYSLLELPFLGSTILKLLTMRIYGGLNSDAYSGVQQWIEVARAQGLLSSIFFSVQSNLY